MREEYALRTPMMSAAASGDYAMFTAVMHAVDRAIRLKAVRSMGALFGARTILRCFTVPDPLFAPM